MFVATTKCFGLIPKYLNNFGIFLSNN
jgi:hypothetical protein